LFASISIAWHIRSMSKTGLLILSYKPKQALRPYLYTTRRYCYPLVADIYSQFMICFTLEYTIKSLGDNFSISPTLHTGLSYLINPTYYKYPVLDIVPARCSIPRTI